jgi:ribose/xylose/arabinose/galactoside ABC-type transport system permease subunit
MTPVPPETNRRLGGFLHSYRNELGLLAAILIVLAVTMTIDGSYWQKPRYNAEEIARQTALLGIFALGAGIVIISGGIDLSSGSVITFSGSICALTLMLLAPADDRGTPDTSQLGAAAFSIAILASLVSGFLVGTLHAWLITCIGLPPFVATLASLVGLRSLTKVMNQEVTRRYFDSESAKLNLNNQAFSDLGQLWWPPVLAFLLLGLLLWLLMSKSIVGRHLYAMGGNENAARLSGIRTDRLKWLAYVIGAVTASIAGVLYTAEVGSADPQTQARGYELNAIAAAVVGGCSLQGGVGLIPGIMLGVLFLRIVVDAVAKTVGSGSDDYEGLIVGFLVVIAVAFNELRANTRRNRKEFFPGLLGWFAVGHLSLMAGIIGTLVASPLAGTIAAGAAVVLLIALKIGERKAKQ